MIFCNLKGGLGNMLFQIAATKSIALENNTECSFPNLLHHLDYLNYENNNNPKLKHSLEYLTILKPLNTEGIKNNYPFNSYMVINYPFYYEDIQLPNTNILIDGHFQTEKYFKKYKDTILELFDFSLHTEYVNTKYSYINEKKCTSIHIRRGDYLKKLNRHPTQSLEYYLKAIEILEPITDKFLVFSDDIKWCKENIKIKNVIYFEHEKDYIELYLMSLCKNNIISNSTFSWWGAWLNQNINKIIIGPKLWFGPAIQTNENDIIPEEWIKI